MITWPWGVAFDERVPGSTVVSAGWVRRMKRGLSEGELRAVVREERRHLRTGKPFDRYVARFEHWGGRNTWRRDWRRGGSATAQVWRCSGGDRWPVGGWGRDWR